MCVLFISVTVSARGTTHTKQGTRGQTETTTIPVPETINASDKNSSTIQDTVSEDKVIHRASRRESDIGNPTGGGGYGSAGEGNENNFQVPKSLCSACEKFPWTPVSGAEYPRNNAPSFQQNLQFQQQPQQQQQQQQPTGPGGDGGYNNVQLPNRRPFAISSDSQAQNAISLPPSVRMCMRRD